MSQVINIEPGVMLKHVSPIAFDVLHLILFCCGLVLLAFLSGFQKPEVLAFLDHAAFRKYVLMTGAVYVVLSAINCVVKDLAQPEAAFQVCGRAFVVALFLVPLASGASLMQNILVVAVNGIAQFV